MVVSVVVMLVVVAVVVMLVAMLVVMLLATLLVPASIVDALTILPMMPTPAATGRASCEAASDRAGLCLRCAEDECEYSEDIFHVFNSHVSVLFTLYKYQRSH